eukprot:5193060-Pyramimonas_sp.AAC.2
MGKHPSSAGIPVEHPYTSLPAPSPPPAALRTHSPVLPDAPACRWMWQCALPRSVRYAPGSDPMLSTELRAPPEASSMVRMMLQMMSTLLYRHMIQVSTAACSTDETCARSHDAAARPASAAPPQSARRPPPPAAACSVDIPPHRPSISEQTISLSA